MTKIYAIIPIKHESTRVPGKNFRLMNGYPLYYWVINTLLKVNEISKIIIDTNSQIIFEDLPKYFNSDKVILYSRPKHLCPGDTPTNELLINVINSMNLDADLYFQTHVTNPLLKEKTIKDAIYQFVEKRNHYDSLFSVKTHYTRFYSKDGKDMNHNRFILIPTQDLDPIYEENSCIYIFSKEILEKYKARIGQNALLFPISDIESQDIDWENDFLITETLMKTFYL